MSDYKPRVKWSRLAVVCAVFFALGVVVWNILGSPL